MNRAWKWMGLALALGCGGPPSQQGLHQACTPGSRCSQGQLCLEYTGFAGQPLASCEIPCNSRSDCPEPLDCAAVADGPEQPTCQ
jgi:hypothetical protein